MAASSTRGPKGQPRFPANEAPDLGVDEELVGDYAAKVGNRRVDTAVLRENASGVDVWDGLMWGDTTDGNEYKYTSTGWKLWGSKAGAAPFAAAAGVANFSGVGGSVNAPIYWDNAVTVTFPAGRFTQPPIVTVTGRQTSGIVWPIISTAPTVNGFTVQGVRVGSLTTSAMSFSWDAVQMTASSAAG